MKLKTLPSKPSEALPAGNCSASTALDETCLYCGRIQWGALVYLGHEHWRHQECAPGSVAWKEYYDRLPKHKRTSAGDLLRG